MQPDTAVFPGQKVLCPSSEGSREQQLPLALQHPPPRPAQPFAPFSWSPTLQGALGERGWGRGGPGGEVPASAQQKPICRGAQALQMLLAQGKRFVF